MSGSGQLFEFELGAETSVLIQTHGAEGDSVLTLYDASFALIAENDDGGVGYWSRMVAVLEPGQYYLEVRPYDASSSGAAYDLHYRHAVDAYEYDDEPSAASSTQVGVSQSRSILPLNDRDWLYMEVDALARLTIQTSGVEGDTILDLFTADNLNEPALTVDDTGGSLWAAMTVEMPAGGYYVRVRSYGGSVIDAYTLLVEPLADDAPGDSVLEIPERCPAGQFRDCDGQCFTEAYLTWLEDAYCDDGSESPVNLNCAAWGYDGGACVEEALLSCGQIYNCLVDAAGADAAVQACLDAGSPEGLESLNTLLVCLDQFCSEASPETYSDCAYAYCPDEIAVFLTGSSDCVSAS